MRCRLIGVLACLVLGAVTVQAGGKVWTPKAGSDERKMVLDAARVPVERDLGQPVIFKIIHLRVSDGWAFVNGLPMRSDGKPIDYSKSIYAEDVKEGLFSEEAAVLLARQDAGWRVVTYSVGFGDVVWDGWDEEFGAPEWLWP